MILTPLWEAGKSCRAGRYSCDQAAAAEEVKRAAGGTGDSGEHAPWVRRGIRGEEGILWGMPGESRGTLRAAPCACVELISSPLPSSLLSAAALSLFRVPECWQHQRRARSPSGPGPAASSRPPTLFSSSLRLRLCVSLCSSLPRPLAIPPSPSVISSSFSSLRGTFAFLRCCVLYSRYRHPLIKLSHSPFPFPCICLHLCPIHPFPCFIPFLSGMFLLLLFIGLPTFYVLRLIFPIQYPLIKLYFASPCGFLKTFWEIAFQSRGHIRSRLHVSSGR